MLFELGTVYNFSTISTNVLQPYYKNLTAASYLGFKQAIKYSGIFNDVITVNEQLKAETGLSLVNPLKSKYVLFENENGEEILLAEDWIKTNTITAVTSLELNLKIKSITNDDVAIILNTLRAMGYNNIEQELEPI